jgi:excisionase family DNA binding protein
MTLTEAGASLGVSPETLRIQIAKGKLRAERHGRDWWVVPSEVERYRRESRGRHQPSVGHE